jgi:hypothetical protein
MEVTGFSKRLVSFTQGIATWTRPPTVRDDDVKHVFDGHRAA